MRRLSSAVFSEGGSPAIVAGAGATLAEVRGLAARLGMEFPLDIGARAEATVGGMLATDAAGRHAWRHGSMRSLAARTEAVLADGTPVGGTAPGGGIGAVEGMFAGSEGGLGIITAARLRLIPHRPRRALAVIPAGGADEAAGLARKALGLHAIEAVEVVFTADAAQLLERHLGLAPLFDPLPDTVLFVEVAGGEDLPDVLAEVADEGTLIGDDTATRERLWRHREAISEITVGPEPCFKAAVGIPGRNLAGFEQSLRSEFPNRPLALFGHLSTGAFHLNLHGVPADRHDAVREQVVASTLAVGGWIAAEHGFGRTYRPWLARVVAPRDLATAGAMKSALDPSGVMNPGVGGFPDPG
jgi:FAD/FMN-containing dehydrogenase